MKSLGFAWFNPILLLLAALFATGVAALYLSTTNERDLYFFEIDITSDSPSRTQLFYDRGLGFRQEESAIQALLGQTGSVRYRFALPRGEIRALRLDPTEMITRLTLGRPVILDAQGREIKKFAIDDLAPLNQVEITPLDNNSARVTSSGTDPSLQVRVGDPITLRTTETDTIRTGMIKIWLPIFGACWLFAGSLQLVPKESLLRLKAYALARPLATLLCTSLIAVVIQCHPIIFFGKSFVSPDNGTFLFYDHAPTLPGYITEGQEDAQGSDVAALLHGSLAYPGLQRKALFQDGEFPLWNRYSLGGLPLIGQGQSMFGSLLNFISVLGDSSAGSWDLRFVLSRWLYSLGLGIAAWLLTRQLGAANFTAFVGLFIGFFGFRLNHMAQLSVDLSPWILVGWAMLKDRKSLRAAAILFLSNWEVMNSGTVKEAYMLMLCLNFTGVLIIGLAEISLSEKLARLCIAILAGVCVILIGAPLWLVFLDSLGTGSTHYELASVQQAPPWQILGFFEEMFYRRFHSIEAHVLPAVNFAIFGGVVWTVVASQEAWKQKSCLSLSLGALLPGFITFGIIPASLLMKMPFINNIYHVHNTFSCPLLVLSTVLAAFGFKAIWTAAHESNWWRKFAEFCAVIFGLFLFYKGSSIDPPGSSFYKAFVSSLGLALFAGHIGLRNWARSRHLGVLALSIGTVVFFTCWQNSEYLKTPVDRYVFNPGKRVNLRATSDSIKHVNLLAADEPWRIVALGYNVFAGYSQMLSWESIYGVDPIRNSDFDILCKAADMTKKDWGDPGSWHEDNLPVILPIQNLLNVKYYLAGHSGTPAEIKGLRWIASHDLDLYESPNSWPRAFYTDRYTTYGEPEDFVALLRSAPDRQPLAAVQSSAEPPSLPSVAKKDLSSRLVAPARDYHLSTNVTKFTIDAPRAGLAVLAENYLSRDFRAYLNGKSVPYIKVNQSCKGVVIPEAGTYEVSFEYRPHRFTLALTMMTIGVFMAVSLILARFYIKWAKVLPFRPAAAA